MAVFGNVGSCISDSHPACTPERLAVRIPRCLISCLVSQLKNNIHSRTSQQLKLTHSIKQSENLYNSRTTPLPH